ncbi:ABC-three component system middle component 6 [Acanthopleuribacter pedis]|uniref:Uncharacterized protein n=1 Tax=Acanthopleuribacter pedis TaxID=442870 RepID=A0A8J7QNA6_9BACT|nr:ABC-three component system middle component 6 [Acanthopleuribacter pedis]MBO1321563.1 hypothetical protein [Acanthopleuribacter pedis]
MIVEPDLKPENHVYYLGAVVLEALLKTTSKRQKVFDLFEAVRQVQTVGVPVFMATLDWLFLIGAVRSEGEELVLCS